MTANGPDRPVQLWGFPMFSVGDRIFYPIFGIGTIGSIETRIVLDEEREYYVLRFGIDRTEVSVPTANAERSGLRRLSPENDCREAVRVLKELSPEQEDETNWNKRYRENLERLRTGRIMDMAYVVRRLADRESRRGLSSGEKKMLTEASAMLAGELGEVLGGSPEEYLPLMK